MNPERQGYQPRPFDSDQSAFTLNFSSSRAPYGSSRTFGEVAQALNLGTQDAEWIQMPGSRQVPTTEKSETEPTGPTEIPKSTQNANIDRNEPERIQISSPVQGTNQRRSESLPTHTLRSTQSPNERRSESERIQIPRPRQVPITERRESERIQLPRPFPPENQERSESVPIMVTAFVFDRNELTNDSEQPRYLDPRLDRLGQRRPHARPHEYERGHEFGYHVCQPFIWQMKSICTGFFDRLGRLPNGDVTSYQVLFLTSLQLLVISVLTMVCLQKDATAHSIVHSHKWVLGLSFLMCFSVLIARACCPGSFELLPTGIIMFLMWSAGVVLTVSWITILLSFDFLALVVVFLELWIASTLVAGFIFAQPLMSYCSTLMPLCIVAGSAALFITVGSKSIMSVSFAAFASILLLMYIYYRLIYLTGDCGWRSSASEVFYVATCIVL